MPSSAVQKCARSEEHTSELQSHDNLVCRLLLEKKNDCSVAGAGRAATLRRRRAQGAAARARVPAARVHTLGAGALGGRRGGLSVFFFLKEPAPPGISPFPQPPPLPF